MNREEQLALCKVCKNKKFDIKQGIICSLTNEKANFENNCESFFEDSVLIEKLEIEEANRKQIGNSASQGKRLANYIIDRLLFLAFSYILGMFLGIFLAIFVPSALRIFELDSFWVNYLFGFFIGMIFYSTLEALTGRTIAKYITKTKVIDENENKPSYGKILVRTLCRFIPFEAFSFLGEPDFGWHDKLSNTRVIEV